MPVPVGTGEHRSWHCRSLGGAWAKGVRRAAISAMSRVNRGGMTRLRAVILVWAVASGVRPEVAEILEDLHNDLLGGDLLQVVRALDGDLPGVR